MGVDVTKSPHQDSNPASPYSQNHLPTASPDKTQTTSSATTSPDSSSHSIKHNNNSRQLNIPAEDETAQRIMHLLSEIGNSNMVEKMAFSDRNFVNCAHCTGKLMLV